MKSPSMRDESLHLAEGVLDELDDLVHRLGEDAGLPLLEGVQPGGVAFGDVGHGRVLLQQFRDAGLERLPGDRGVRQVVLHAAFVERVLQLQAVRSEEHTSELQSLMRISYAVFCLKKKK